MPDRPLTAMAFDYGRRKIGLAFGNTLTGTSSPLDVLPNPAGAPDWSGIAARIDEWKPATLLVGLPLNMDGSESPLSREAREFARSLAKRHGLPVCMMDERLSTREAREQAAEAGHRSRDAVDALAAQRILSCWLTDPGQAITP